MPEFKLLAIDFGSFFREVSAASLHMAHCAETSNGTINKKRNSVKAKRYLKGLCMFNYKSKAKKGEVEELKKV